MLFQYNFRPDFNPPKKSMFGPLFRLAECQVPRAVAQATAATAGRFGALTDRGPIRLELELDAIDPMTWWPYHGAMIMIWWWYDDMVMWWCDEMMIWWWYDDMVIWWYDDDMMIWWCDDVIIINMVINMMIDTNPWWWHGDARISYKPPTVARHST